MNHAMSSTSFSARDLVHFPSQLISENRRALEIAAILFWATVPLQYFVTSRIAGGASGADILIGPISWSVASAASVIAFSVLLALVRGGAKGFVTQVRTLSLSLVINWMATVVLIAASYAIMTSLNLRGDLLAHYACSEFTGPWLNCKGYPAVLGAGTYAIYFIYSLVAASLLSIVVRKVFSSSELGRDKIKEPNIILVAILTAVPTALIHGLIVL
jgi:hypothetical protein